MATAVHTGTPTVLLLGATGRTGRRALRQLLARGARVRAVVRSAARLPDGVTADAGLSVVEADLLALDDERFAGLVDGVDAVVCCLGHTLTAQGVYGKPRDLVTQAARRVCRAATALQPERPVRFVLMSSVSVLRPGRQDAHRGPGVKALLRVLHGLVPPAHDNQLAADFLAEAIGTDGRSVEWVVVRPDSLKEGDVSEYGLSEDPVTGLFHPRETRMANVAHFMCELATDAAVWETWRGKLPVIVDAVSAREPARPRR